jgi:hypothetical protein
MSEREPTLDDAKPSEAPPTDLQDGGSAVDPAPSVQKSSLELTQTAAVNPDIHRLVWVLLRGWWIILIVIILSVLYSAYSLTKHSPVYTSHMVVREIDKDDGGLALPARLSGLATNLGVQVGKKAISPFDEFTILLGTDRFARELDRKYGYLRAVFGGQWNEETQSWNPPTGWRVDLDDYFRDFAPIAEWTPPGTQQLAQYVAGNVLIVTIKGQLRIWRVQYQHPDQQFAMQFLRDAFDTAEDMLHRREVERVLKQVEYVKKRLASITVSEYRQSLVYVLAQQEKRLLELQSGQPYIAEILQPAVVTDRPSSPNVLVRLILGAIVGVALGVLAVVVIAFLRTILSRRPVRV